MTNEIKGGEQSQVFDYKQVDEQMAEFLRRKETIIWSAYETMIETVGGELKDAQERLAGSNQYDGVFEKWYTALGFTKQTVYNYISYHSVVKLVDEQKLKIDVEELPKKLVYAIGSQSSESSPEKAQAKSEVLAGDIATLKEYRDRIAELEGRAKQAERQADIERSQRERLEEENEQLAEKADKPPEVRTEYIEVKDEIAERKLQRYEELFGDVSMYEGRTTRVTNGDAITYTVFEFSEDVRKFIEKYGHLTHFAREFNEMIGEGKSEYRKAIEDMVRFMGAIERNLNEEETIIING